MRKSVRFVSGLSLRILLAAVLCVVATGRASAQTRTAADGPWAGWAQCQLTAQLNAQGDTYLNHVTHTWVLTGLTPTSGTDIKVYQSTWTVVGQGTHQRQYGEGRTLTEQWTTASQTLPDTMTIRVSADGLVHINSGAQLRSTTATSGTSVTHSSNGNARDETRAIAYNVDEWVFPVVQDAATNTTISGSTTGPAANISPGQPPGTSGTAACSWQFQRGAAAAMAPPPASGSVAQAPPSPTPAPTPPSGTQPATSPTLTVPTLSTASAAPAPSPSPAPAPSNSTATISPTNLPLNRGVIAGNASSADTLTALTQSDPTGFRAVQVDDGTVQLTWNAATGVSAYMVGGPGTNNGVQVTGTTYTVRGISAGMQTWSIASLPVVTPFDKWPTATASVMSPFSGVAAAPVSATTTTPGRQAFTTSGTFTVPNGVTRVTVELWGAGAGGAGAPPIGHGGGGGAYTRIVIGVSQGASLRIVIGAGGAGGAAGSSPAMNGADGASTQLMLQANVLAEADGGKGDGAGGRKSSASGISALAGLDGKPPQPIYYSDGSIYAYRAGPGGGAVTGSVAPIGTTGGGGGSSQQVCYDLFLTNCSYESYPGGAGLNGYALISY